jgi:hypothetical protein
MLFGYNLFNPMSQSTRSTSSSVATNDTHPAREEHQRPKHWRPSLYPKFFGPVKTELRIPQGSIMNSFMYVELAEASCLRLGKGGVESFPTTEEDVELTVF